MKILFKKTEYQYCTFGLKSENLKRKLILLLSVVALMIPQTMKAQENGDGIGLWYIHMKDTNPHVTLDTNPEDIVGYLLSESGGGDFMMKNGTWLELQRTVTDRFGNVHVTYNQMFDTASLSDYQLVLHFHPDGSLYYRNGTIILEKKEAQNAKVLKPANMISAEKASIIATGSPLNEVVRAFANIGDKPREAYKVKDQGRMQYVYVDAYSGEVLYTIPIIRSFAPWSEVKGSAVTLSARTSYNGLQELTVMQTDKGYILRDPERNIVTVDATDVLADRGSQDLPKDYYEQFRMFTDACDDMTFSSKEELHNQKYTNSLRGITIWLDPDMKKAPESLTVRIGIRSVDSGELPDVIKIETTEAVWTDDNGRLKTTLTFEEKPNIDLVLYSNLTEVVLDGKTYFANDNIVAGNKEASRMIDLTEQEFSNVDCLVDVETDATQQAIDVHCNIQKVYDMYNEYYGIKGCDGKGSQIINIVNPGNNVLYLNTSGFPYNAIAIGQEITDHNGEPSYVMMYGMGGPMNFKPLTPLDVNAHEFTHNVTAGCCNNLLYLNESGALNEALADCMAMVAEDYVYGAPTWLIGNDIMLYSDNMRSLSNPWYSGCDGEQMYESGAQPKYYGGRFWVDYQTMDPNDPRYDNGGVHTNSGVFNYLFYLLCEGGINMTNEKEETMDIIPVGMEMMKDILFHTMRYYNASLCTYAEIADNLMMTIEDIYGHDRMFVADLQRKLQTAYTFVGIESEMYPTGITRHTMDTKASDFRAYNLYGIPVGDDYKGIVIKNGRKVIQK